MSNKNEKVTNLLENKKTWKNELIKLREIMLETDLVEDFKWYAPCYTYKNKNIVLLGGFKEFFIVSFVKGSLLKDEFNVLERQGENTESARVIKFYNIEEIANKASIIHQYVKEAIILEEKGVKVQYTKAKDVVFVEELIDRLNSDSIFKEAFEKLTPGRQKGYNFFISSAKQSATRNSRIDKYYDRILLGKGINDK